MTTTTTTMECSAHPDLQLLRDRLTGIHGDMGTYAAKHTAVKPPILDTSLDLTGEGADEFHLHNDAVHGLRALRDAVRRDLDVINKFLANPACASLPPLSTNAPYLISVWNEVLNAPPPITAIWRTFVEAHARRSTKGYQKPAGMKVDVVADGGRRWIRVNTTKNSRLLAEFRELDSYLTDSEGEDESARGPAPELDNSIIRVGRTLLDAARQNPLPGTGPPSITLRLTRLEPSAPRERDRDPRIAQTIGSLRNMGIDVELGELEPSTYPSVTEPPVPRRLEPTLRINLDLSLLVALVSDISHAPTPGTTAEAEAQYVPSLRWREERKQRLGQAGRDTDGDGLEQHTRALSNQALQEMGRGLLQEVHDRLAAVPGCAPDLHNVEFWTTPEARDRCRKIVAKIGGPEEKRRMGALLSADGDEEAYWMGSRFPRGFLPLAPLRIHPTPEPDDAIGPPDDVPPFFAVLARACRNILAQGPLHVPNPLDASEEIERAAVTKANPRLTAHTVQSMLWGAARGWTTLTANKSSVKALVRDIWAGEGGTGDANLDDGDTAEKAAIWVVDPRSLAEGMRADFTGSYEG